MKRNWLYPLVRHSGFYFQDGAKNRLPDTEFESFKQMMRQPSDVEWFRLATNFRQVKVGDRVWMYYGRADGDRGVVGVGVIIGVEPYENGTHAIQFKWKRVATKHLMKNPVWAGTVRHYLPFPRAAVQDLDRFPELVKELEVAAHLNSDAWPSAAASK